MRDFIDKTSTQSGTPLNRDYMLALQDFDGKTVILKDDGTIVETNSLGHTRTITVNDTIITEIFSGDRTVTKTTRIDLLDNMISEVLS